MKESNVQPVLDGESVRWRIMLYFLLKVDEFRFVFHSLFQQNQGCSGCPNKHGNSVTNSISSFQLTL